MDLLHSTWFWCVIAAAPFVLVISTLARLSRREPPPDLPPGVSPGTYRKRAGDDDDDNETRPD